MCESVGRVRVCMCVCVFVSEHMYMYMSASVYGKSYVYESKNTYNYDIIHTLINYNNNFKKLLDKNLIDKLNNIGFVCVQYSGFNIQNIVTSFNSGFLIDLGEFSLKYRKESFYNPEIFCGLHFKIHPRIIVLIFYTGKIVITGCKNMDECDFMFRKLKRYLF